MNYQVLLLLYYSYFLFLLVLTITSQRRIGDIYARVSTPEQVRGYSIEIQIESLESIFKKEKIVLHKIHSDEGKSGTIIKRRYGLQSLLQDIIDGIIDVVGITDLSRLARNLMDQMSIIKFCIENNILIMTQNGPLDVGSPEGNLSIEILGAIHEYESKKHGERSRRGLKKRFENKLWIGGVVPYGYFYNRNNGGQLIIHIIESIIIKELYIKYLEDNSTISSITQWLNENPKISPRRAKKFSSKVVSQILRNRTYLGEITLREEYYVLPELQIIPEELFLTVQKKLERNRINSPNYGGRYSSKGHWVDELCYSCGTKLPKGAFYCHACGKFVKSRLIQD